MNTRVRVFLSALCLIAFTSATAFADKILLTSGETIEGKILHETDDYVVIEILEPGVNGELKLQKKYIKSVEVTTEKDLEYKERLAAIDQAKAEEHYQLAVWCLENKLAEQAEKHFKRAISIDPLHEKAHLALGHRKVGDSWVEGMDNEAAEHVLSTEQWEKFEELYTRAAMAFMDSRYKEASLIFEEALAINPYSKRANKDLALSLFKAELWAKARKQFEKILDDQSKDYSFRRDYAKVLLHLDDTAKATSILDQLLKEVPDDYDTWAAKAYVLYMKGEYDDSLKAYEKVYELLKEKGLDYVPNAHMGMGLCYTRLKKFQKAYSQFDIILKHDALDLEAVYAYGQALLDEGNRDEAMKKFKFYYEYSDEDSPHRVEVAKILKKSP